MSSPRSTRRHRRLSQHKSSKPKKQTIDPDQGATQSGPAAATPIDPQKVPTSEALSTAPRPSCSEKPDTSGLPRSSSNMATAPAAVSSPDVGCTSATPEENPASPVPPKGKGRFSMILRRPRARGTQSRKRSAEMEEALHELRETVSSKGSPLSPTPSAAHQRMLDAWKRKAEIITLFFFAAVVLLIVVHFANFRMSPRVVPAVCSRLACIDHVHQLGLLQDKSPDACEDFGRFVCSGWLPNNTRTAPSTETFRLAYWLLGLTQLPEDPSRPVTKGARQMMDACLRLEQAPANAEDLVDFMSKELFPWLLETTDARLVDPDDYSVPLKALVRLSVLWVTPLWFFVSLIEPWHGTGQRRSVSMSPSGMPFLSSIINREINDYNLYQSIASFFVSDLFRGKPVSPEFKKFATGSTHIQRSILGNLSHFFNATHPRPRLLLIRQLPALVPKLRARDWVNAFQSTFNAKPALTEEDTLVASNGDLFDAMRVIFNSFSARELTFHTAWWFIQLLGPLTSTPVRQLFSRHPLSGFFTKVACAISTTIVYTILLSVTEAQKLVVLGLFKNLHETALAELSSWSSLDTKAVRTVYSQLQSTSTVAWPPEEYITNKSLEFLYGRDYGTAQSFFDHWRKSREQLQKSLRSEQYQASLRLFRLQSAHLAAYNPVTNVISVAAAAFATPYYADEGTDAMVYGGLGIMYSMQLVRTINALTILLSEDMTQTPWYPSSTDIDASGGSTSNIGAPGKPLWELARCSADATGENVTALFPLLPALKIAHAAYLHFRSDDRDRRLRGMEEYSPEQVFFLTACHVTCGGSMAHIRVSPECTEAMRNFEPFTKAFSCPLGSPMNPKRKCVFL